MAREAGQVTDPPGMAEAQRIFQATGSRAEAKSQEEAAATSCWESFGNSINNPWPGGMVSGQRIHTQKGALTGYA